MNDFFHKQGQGLKLLAAQPLPKTSLKYPSPSCRIDKQFHRIGRLAPRGPWDSKLLKEYPVVVKLISKIYIFSLVFLHLTGVSYSLHLAVSTQVALPWDNIA